MRRNCHDSKKEYPGIVISYGALRGVLAVVSGSLGTSLEKGTCKATGRDLTLLVRRGIVTGVVSDVKTKYSNAGIPLDPALAEVLLRWQRTTLFKNPEDWVFASPYVAGRMPWYPWGVERRHIIPAGIRCGIGRIGWHTFRHTFRTLLDETGAPMKVQQELMRHADIRTTMNVYGKAMDESKRDAHRKVVSLVLPSKVA